MSAKLTISCDKDFHFYEKDVFDSGDYYLEVCNCHECHHAQTVVPSREQWRKIAEEIMRREP